MLHRPDKSHVMDVLREWLITLTLRELGFIANGNSQPEEGPKPGRVATITRDVKNWKFPRFVQLLKFSSFEEPIRALISDSYVRVEAEFRPEAVKAFELTHQQQRITRGTRGGIIQINSCELVFRPPSSTAPCVCLVIKDCRFVGSGGSSFYGHPRSLETYDQVKKLLHTLFPSPHELASMKNPPHGTGRDILIPPDRAEAESEDDRDGSSLPRVSAPATQLPLSTQLPSGHATSRLSRRGVTKMEDKHDPQFHRTVSGSGEISPAVQKMASHNVGNLLLALKIRPNNSSSIQQTGTYSTPAKPGLTPSTDVLFVQTSSNKRAPTPKKPQVLRSEVADHEQDEHSPPLSQEESPAEQQEPLERINPSVQAEKAEVRCQISRTTVTVSQEIRNDVSSPSTRFVEKNRVSDGPRTDSTIPACNKSPNNLGPATVLIGASALRAIEDNPWQGMTRIRKRDVKIPKDQEPLLQHKDCWVPPEPGSRGPYANVPLKLLNSLNERMEQHLQKTKVLSDLCNEEAQSVSTSQTQSTNGSSSSGDYDGNDVASSNNIPWSPSPPRPAAREQLPPDSSAPEIDHHEARSRSLTELSHNQPSDKDAVNKPDDGPPSKRRRTEDSKARLPNSEPIRLDQASPSPRVSRARETLKSDISQKYSMELRSEEQPQNSPSNRPYYRAAWLQAATSPTHGWERKKSLSALVPSSPEAEDSEMESCLPTALGDERCYPSQRNAPRSTPQTATEHREHVDPPQHKLCPDRLTSDCEEEEALACSRYDSAMAIQEERVTDHAKDRPRLEALPASPREEPLSGIASKSIQHDRDSIIPCGLGPNDIDTDNVFEQFKHAYPEYRGTLRAFVMTCALIEWLCEEECMEPRGWWDQYVFRCLPKYEQWCHDSRVDLNNIPDVKHSEATLEDLHRTKAILTPDNLLDALRLDPGAAGEMRYGIIANSMTKLQLAAGKRGAHASRSSSSPKTSHGALNSRRQSLLSLRGTKSPMAIGFRNSRGRSVGEKSELLLMEIKSLQKSASKITKLMQAEDEEVGSYSDVSQESDRRRPTTNQEAGRSWPESQSLLPRKAIEAYEEDITPTPRRHTEAEAKSNTSQASHRNLTSPHHSGIDRPEIDRDSSLENSADGPQQDQTRLFLDQDLEIVDSNIKTSFQPPSTQIVGDSGPSQGSQHNLRASQHQTLSPKESVEDFPQDVRETLSDDDLDILDSPIKTPTKRRDVELMEISESPRESDTDASDSEKEIIQVPFSGRKPAPPITPTKKGRGSLPTVSRANVPVSHTTSSLSPRSSSSFSSSKISSIPLPPNPSQSTTTHPIFSHPSPIIPSTSITTNTTGSDSIPHHAPAASASVPSPDKWWTDYNTPFKEYARAYVELKSVAGRLGSVDRTTGGIIPVQPSGGVDFLKWQL